MGCPQSSQGPTTLSLPWMTAYCRPTGRSARSIKVARCLIAPPTIGRAGRRSPDVLIVLNRDLTAAHGGAKGQSALSALRTPCSQDGLGVRGCSGRRVSGEGRSRIDRGDGG